MLCAPVDKLEVEKVPFPADSELVPMVVVPSRKVTVPVGAVRPDAGETVAVKVRLAPLTAVAEDAASAVVVAIPALTVMVTTVEVLVLKLASPL